VRDGQVQQQQAGVFGLGDETVALRRTATSAWRLPALLALAFAEDIAIVDAADATVPWMAVALPSHWAPETRSGATSRRSMPRWPTPTWCARPAKGCCAW
jgi:hypothetical protein